jgi:hypothetical protein
VHPLRLLDVEAGDRALLAEDAEAEGRGLQRRQDGGGHVQPQAALGQAGAGDRGLGLRRLVRLRAAVAGSGSGLGRRSLRQVAGAAAEADGAGQHDGEGRSEGAQAYRR